MCVCVRVWMSLNHGVKSFFSKESALKMNRAELGDGEYGYTLTTDEVNWEWGFAFEREDGQMYYEIGKADGVGMGKVASIAHAVFSRQSALIGRLFRHCFLRPLVAPYSHHNTLMRFFFLKFGGDKRDDKMKQTRYGGF